jgi:hypothetical protein
VKLKDRTAAERRYVLLKLLVETGGRASEAELFNGLDMAGYNVGLSEQVVRDDVKWLEQRDLASHTMLAGTMMMVKLERRGVRVIEGRETIDGLTVPLDLE